MMPVYKECLQRKQYIEKTLLKGFLFIFLVVEPIK